MPPKPLAKGCRIVSIKNPMDMVVTNREGRVFAETGYGLSFGLHIHTVEQELKTMCNRHLQATPEPDLLSSEWKLFRSTYRRNTRARGKVSPCHLLGLLEGKMGRRKRRFYEGIRLYKERGVSRRDAVLTSMQKLEFYEECKIPIKEDRGIQFRSVVYNVALGRYIRPMEQRMAGYHHGIVQHHPVVKGLTPKQMAERLFYYASQFDNPSFVLVDHSRFDAHVNEHLVKVAHENKRWQARYDPEFCRVLKSGVRTKGYTKGGITYICNAKRKSGDPETSEENTDINENAIEAAMEFLGVVKYVVQLLGDDAYIIIERGDVPKMQGLGAFMLKLGLVTEYSVTNDIWKVEFCQMRPCLLPDGPTFVRNPFKVAGVLLRTPQNHSPVDLQGVIRSSCMSELAVGPGTPVSTPLAKRILKYLGKGRVFKTAKQLYKEQTYGYTAEDVIVEEVPEPDELARITMWRSWGIEPGHQVMLENQDLPFIAELVHDKRSGVVGAQDPHMEAIPEISCELDLGGFGKPTCECGDCPEYPTGEDMAIEAQRWL